MTREFAFIAEACNEIQCKVANVSKSYRSKRGMTIEQLHKVGIAKNAYFLDGLEIRYYVFNKRAPC